MLWTLTTAEPSTTQTSVRIESVRVECEDQQGLVKVVWDEHRNVKISGPVYSEERFFDANGSEYRELEVTILDSYPTFRRPPRA